MRHVMAGLVAGSLFLGVTGCTIVVPNTPAKPATPASAATPATPATNVAQKVSEFVGSWDTTYGVLTLTENGNRVTGTYGKFGKVDGTLSTDRKSLEATWTEADSSGKVTFRVSEDGNEITGIYSEDGTSGKKKDWTGPRLQAAAEG